MAKRYWLKLQSGFFDQAEIKILEGLADGKAMVLVWLKILLLTIRGTEEVDCGILRVNEKIPYSPGTLGSVIGESPALIEKAINVFVDLGMIALAEDGVIFIDAVQTMIGKETDAAERMRKFRAKQVSVTKLQKPVTMFDNKEEEEEEEEKEKEKEIGGPTALVPVSSNGQGKVETIVRVMNHVLNTRFREKSADTVKKVTARIKEGYTPAQFLAVIAIKAQKWASDDKMMDYLRPATLFSGGHFESYLQEWRSRKKPTPWDEEINRVADAVKEGMDGYKEIRKLLDGNEADRVLGVGAGKHSPDGVKARE